MVLLTVSAAVASGPSGAASPGGNPKTPVASRESISGSRASRAVSLTGCNYPPSVDG